MSKSKTQNPTAEHISLRPVTADDREFLLRVYECSREIELSMVPWDAATRRAFVEHQFDAQSSYYSSEYQDPVHHVIKLADEPVGRLYVNRTDTEIAILDITVLSQYRGRGIGSSIVGDLLDEARRSDKSVQVYAETFNPSQEFFTKRGFKIENNDGVNLKLVWNGKKV